MLDNYTRKTENFLLSIASSDTNEIWDQIESVPRGQTTSYWETKLKELARDYSTSSRYAIIRILCNKAKERQGRKDKGDNNAFSDEINGRVYHFSRIDKEHSDALTPQEHEEYLSYIFDFVSSYGEELSQQEKAEDKELVLKAWYDVESANAVAEAQLLAETPAGKKIATAMKKMQKENQRKYKTILTKEETLQLGHILHFSLEEVQWYMLRVLDYQGGFRYNQAEDLIEEYCFLTQRNWRKAQELKDEYGEKSSSIEKLSDYSPDRPVTADASEDLANMISVWQEEKDNADKLFMDWLLARAPHLDTVSYKSTFLFRSIAVLAYQILMGADQPSEEQFADYISDIRDIYEDEFDVEELLYEEGKISLQRCKSVADKLLLDNKIQAASLEADNTKAWHVLTTLSDGSPTAAGSILNASRDRMAQILFGQLQVEKCDMLYLFWFITNLVWQCNDDDDIQVEERIKDFIGMASELLKDALLPDFYLPHLMEQSMLLSIAYGAKTGDDASVIYEYMLQSLTKKRNRKKKDDN